MRYFISPGRKCLKIEVAICQAPLSNTSFKFIVVCLSSSGFHLSHLQRGFVSWWGLLYKSQAHNFLMDFLCRASFVWNSFEISPAIGFWMRSLNFYTTKIQMQPNGIVGLRAVSSGDCVLTPDIPLVLQQTFRVRKEAIYEYAPVPRAFPSICSGPQRLWK